MTQNIEAAKIMQQIRNHRSHLAGLLTTVVAQGQKIAQTRERFKVTEDGIVAEIWANDAYKNDKQRNEQKHLAKINDARFTEHATAVGDMELEKARLHGDILITQNELALLTVQYSAAMSYGNFTDIQFKLVAVEKEQADTTKAVELETAFSHQVEGFEPDAHEQNRIINAAIDTAGDHQAKK